MNPIELACGLTLIAVLTGLAIYFGWQQRQTLLSLQQDSKISPIERDFLRGQVRRRTLCCIFLAVFAAVLVGWFFMDEDFRRLSQQMTEIDPADKAALAAAKEAAQGPLWFYTGYVIFSLILLMIIVALAAADFLATARYGLKHKRKLLSDHQALLALEAARAKQRYQEMD